jgi:hypothetical protein
LKEALENEFPGFINFEGIKDIDVTGNFEIYMIETKQLIHSKKQGLGTCTTSEERERLFKIIRIAKAYYDKKKE